MRHVLLLCCCCLLMSIPAWPQEPDAPTIPYLTVSMGGWGEDADLGLATAAALGAIGEPALPGLAQALDSDNARLRALAAVGLARLGPAANEYIPRVIEELMAQPEMDSESGFSPVYVIAGPLGASGDYATMLLVQELQARGQRAERALLALGFAGADAEVAVPTLAALLGDRDPGLAAGAADALGLLGPVAGAAVPSLVQALQDADPEVRQRAAYALGQLRLRPEIVVPALQAALEQDPANSGWWCTQALGAYGATAEPALPLLAELLADPATCQDASLALVRIGATTAPVLSAALANSSAEVRYYAASGLGAIGPAAAEAVPALLEALEDPDVKVRWNAAQCLGFIGAQPEAVVPALQALLHDSDKDVRYCVVYALGHFNTAAAGALADIAGLLNDPDPTVRWGAAGALLELGAAAAPVQAQLVAALAAPADDSAARGRIVALLLLLESASPEARQAIGTALRTDGAALEVVEALAQLGAPGVAALAEMVARPEPAARLYSAARLVELGAAAGPALPQLQAALDNEADGLCRVVMAHAVAQAGGERIAALAMLTQGLASPDPQAQWYSAYAIANMGQAQEEAVPGLTRLLQSGNWDLQLVAAEALTALGPLAAAMPDVVVPALLQCLQEQASVQ